MAVFCFSILRGSGCARAPQDEVVWLGTRIGLHRRARRKYSSASRAGNSSTRRTITWPASPEDGGGGTHALGIERHPEGVDAPRLQAEHGHGGRRPSDRPGPSRRCRTARHRSAPAPACEAADALQLRPGMAQHRAEAGREAGLQPGKPRRRCAPVRLVERFHRGDARTSSRPALAKAASAKRSPSACIASASTATASVSISSTLDLSDEPRHGWIPTHRSAPARQGHAGAARMSGIPGRPALPRRAGRWRNRSRHRGRDHDLPLARRSRWVRPTLRRAPAAPPGRAAPARHQARPPIGRTSPSARGRARTLVQSGRKVRSASSHSG